MSIPRYPEYKDSGVEWLGEVPAHWERLKLKQIVSTERPITYGIVQAGENVPNGIPYIRPTDMTDELGVKDEASLLRTSPEIASAYGRSELRDGEIVCSIGPSYGKAMITPSSLSGANLTQGTARIAVNDKNHTKFIFWSLRSPICFQQWECSVGGATFRALNLGPLSETLIALPTLPEQNQIARFLDHETAKIDALIQEQQRLIELLKEKRQAVVSHAVTKGLDPTVPMKESGVEWLGEVPAHWGTMAIKMMVEVKDGTHGTPIYVDPSDNSFPLVTSKDFVGGSINFETSKYIADADHKEIIRRSNTQRGDVLMSMIGGNIGKALLVKTSREFSIKNVALFKTGEDLNIAQYILYYLESGLLEVQIDLISRGGAQGFLGLGDIRNLVVPKVPHDELPEIISRLDYDVPKIDDLVRAALTVIELSKERRSALISAAVTGKIDVRNWQPPADETAIDEEIRQAGLEAVS